MFLARFQKTVLVLPAVLLLPAAERSLEAQDQGWSLDFIRDCRQCPEMVVIPAGIGFVMREGAEETEESHEVSFKHSFAISRHEVTFADWDACVEAGACQTVPNDNGWGKGEHPVINVSWNDAQSFILWMRAKTGLEYRLPSEAEWEFAARAGSNSPYPWGDLARRDKANYGRDECCEGLAEGDDKWMYTAPVGSFPANAYGLYDMNGNIWEWTADCWHDNFDGAPKDGSAWDEECEENRHVVRGGSWMNSPDNILTVARNGYRAALHYDHLGFRLARSNE